MTDQAAEGLLSPFLRRQRLRAAAPHLHGRVLDVGCGSGGLASLMPAADYVGIEIDAASRQRAAARFPGYRFLEALPADTERFDTVAALAVLEHVPDPVAFTRRLAGHLADEATARLVLTTPHPSVERLHGIGARIGLFSQAANEEHHALLDRRKLEGVGQRAGLRLALYQRFLLGANQLAVYAKERS